jgi:hypothetical protein
VSANRDDTEVNRASENQSVEDGHAGMDGSQAHWNALRGRHLWREFRVLRSVTADVIPGSLRTHKNVHRYLNAWIAVHGSKSHPMHLSFVGSA